MSKEEYLSQIEAHNLNSINLHEDKSPEGLDRIIAVANANRAMSEEEIESRNNRELIRWLEWLNLP
jgi:hypothetical protein